MRNPVRFKNLSFRLAPFYGFGLLLLVVSQPSWRSLELGLPLVLIGLAVRAWGAGHLVKTKRFTIHGPYAHVRHPLYLGTFLIAAAVLVMLGNWATWVGLICLLIWFGGFYFPRKERIESSRLLGLYGGVYASYRAEVPALLPRLARWTPAAEYLDDVDVNSQWRFERYDANNEQGTFLAVVAVIGLIGLRMLGASG